MTHYENKQSKELRAGMGEGLVEAGRRNQNVVALSADGTMLGTTSTVAMGNWSRLSRMLLELMNNKMKRTLVLVIGFATLLLAGCKHEDRLTYEPEGSIGMEELAAIAQDTMHYRALIFTSPYCYGCRQMNESTQKAVEAMDTSLWRIYYLIVEDIVDSAHWEEVVGDMMDMGIPRELIHHCSLPFEDGMYRDVVALFRTAQPIDPRARMQGVPFELVVDTNNYIPVQRAKAKPEDENYWYVVRDFIYEDWISEYTDFTFDDGSFVVETTPTTTADDRTIVLNR